MLTWIYCIYTHALKKNHHTRYYYSKIYMNLRSVSWYLCKQYFSFSQWCCRRLKFSDMCAVSFFPLFPCVWMITVSVSSGQSSTKTKFFLDCLTISWRHYNPSTHWELLAIDTVSHSTNFEPSFLHVLHKIFCITKKMDSSVINVSVSSNRTMSNKSKYLPTEACRVVTLCSPGRYILLLYA